MDDQVDGHMRVCESEELAKTEYVVSICIP